MSPEGHAQTLVTRIHPGVAALRQAEWDADRPDAAEGWPYYAACEDGAPPPGVRLGAIEVRDAAGMVAAAPLFRLSYRIDTPLQGRLVGLGAALAKHAPRLVEWKLLGIGSPFAERCHVVRRPGLEPAARDAALRALIAGLEAEARASGAGLVAFKDVAAPEEDILAPLARAAGYLDLPSLPVAALSLPEGTSDTYLATLSPAMRKDVRRKLKGAGGVRIEHRTDIAGIEDRIEALYRSTQQNSTVRYGDFEELPGGYFRHVSRRLGARAVFVLYWIGEELAAFNLLLVEEDRVIDKFLGMAYPLARTHNLYVVSWMENVRFCLASGRRVLQSGQTAYASKVRMGSALQPSAIHVRHLNPVLNGLIRLARPLLDFRRWDPDLAALRAAGKIVP